MRENKDGSLGLRMSGLFKDYPSLRPETAKWVSLPIDPSGAFFILHLNLALPQPTRKRKASGKTDKTAAKDAAGGTAAFSAQGWSQIPKRSGCRASLDRDLYRDVRAIAMKVRMPGTERV